jgi:hypothetical protein
VVWFFVSAATAAISIPLSLLSGLADQTLTNSILARPVAAQIQTPCPAEAGVGQDPLRIVLVLKDEADHRNYRTTSPAGPFPTETDRSSTWLLPFIVSVVGSSPVFVVLALPWTHSRLTSYAADSGAAADRVPL